MRLVSACFVLLMLASLALAQKPKPWTEWSKKDVENFERLCLGSDTERGRQRVVGVEPGGRYQHNGGEE